MSRGVVYDEGHQTFVSPLRVRARAHIRIHPHTRTCDDNRNVKGVSEVKAVLCSVFTGAVSTIKYICVSTGRAETREDIRADFANAS